MKLRIRLPLFLLLLLAWGAALAGSYDDFFVAIQRDDDRAVQTLLNRGFDPNTRNAKDQHGLYLAMWVPAPKVAATLIAWSKTDVEPRTQQDESPLMIAALTGQLDLATRLVERGADVNKTGWTPLHYAATRGHLAVMRLLLEHSAYIDAESPNGTTPLMMAAQYGTPQAVKLLLEEGADPLLRNQLNLSAIDFAHRAGRKESAEMIAAFVRARQPRGKW